MPYITPDRREAVDRYLRGEFAPEDFPQNCGELNYAFTMTCLRYPKIQMADLDLRLSRIGMEYAANGPLRYQRLNDIVGAYTCAALEMDDRGRSIHSATLTHMAKVFYASVAVPYEREKIKENGDIAEYGSPR